MASPLLRKLSSPIFKNRFHPSTPTFLPPARTHLGYIPREGRVTIENETTLSRTYVQLKKVNLKPVKKIHFTLDPFFAKVRSIRHAMYYLSAERIRNSGPKCLFKTEVVCDRSEPTIRVELEGGDSLLFKTANLTVEEIVTILNERVLPLVKEESSSGPAPARDAKSGKKTNKRK